MQQIYLMHQEKEQKSMALQTDLGFNPDSSLRDIGVGGMAGGSSSMLARKDTSKENLYVPLKRRMAKGEDFETNEV